MASKPRWRHVPLQQSTAGPFGVNQSRLLQYLVDQQCLASEHPLVSMTKLPEQWLSSLLMSAQGDAIAKVVADYFGFPCVDAGAIRPDALVLEYLNSEYVRLGLAVPYRLKGYLYWAVKDPLGIDWGNVAVISGVPVSQVLARPTSWSKWQDMVDSCRQGQALTEDHQTVYQNDEGSMRPYLQMVLAEAVARVCSDVHFESASAGGVIRFRCHGLLQTYASLSHAMMRALMHCIKADSGLDITESRRPQEGRLSFSLKTGEVLSSEVDSVKMPCLANDVGNARISLCPGFHGEKAVLRLLQPKPKSLYDLGLMQDQLQIITLILKQPQGLIVLAGPTGCGKSSTLHAMLMHCQREHSNIIALEDPVEVGLDGVHQMGMNPAVGLDFSDVLPYVLRADPDIIMVGEVRDAKTAQMALSAAQTGHLVLTTVHGASMGAALSRLQRLAKMSGDDFAITLQLLVEQRLLRKHCELCCGYGCGQCHQGISGRQGIFACHAMQSERLLKKDLSDFCASSSAELRQRAIQYFDQGIVSSAEIDRVLGSESSLTIH